MPNSSANPTLFRVVRPTWFVKVTLAWWPVWSIFRFIALLLADLPTLFRFCIRSTSSSIYSFLVFRIRGHVVAHIFINETPILSICRTDQLNSFLNKLLTCLKLFLAAWYSLDSICLTALSILALTSWRNFSFAFQLDIRLFGNFVSSSLFCHFCCSIDGLLLIFF